MAKELFAAKKTSIWVGGVFHWLLRGCQGRLVHQWTARYERRNFIAGCVLNAIGLIWMFWLLS